MIPEDAAVHIASSLYHQLKPDEEYIMVLQNAVLFVKPIRSFILYIACNILFFIIYSLHFSVYSLFFLFISIKMIPPELYHDYLMKIYNCFNFKAKQDKYLVSRPLPLDHLCVLVSIVMLEVNQWLDYYIRAVKKGDFIDISVMALILSFTFYSIYKIGDIFFLWICLHLISFIPIILTKRITFKLTNFPAKLEVAILKKLRSQIQEEEILARRNLL